MAIERWHPLTDLMTLRQAMNRLVEDSFVRPSRTSETFGQATAPALEVYQTPGEIVVKATLSGVKPEDISIDITSDTLTIKGRTKLNKKSRGKTICIRRDVTVLFLEALSFLAV